MPLHEQVKGEGNHDVTEVLEKFFGWPEKARTDWGPSFREPFDTWCNNSGIIREVSSAYSPSLNGIAEQGVQRVKRIIKCPAMSCESMP